MRYEITTTDSEVTLSLSERFTAVDATTFRRLIDSLPAEGIASVVIEMSGLEYIDSAAMGLLVLVRDNAINRQIAMKIRGPHGQVRKAFDIFNFDQLFTVEL